MPHRHVRLQIALALAFTLPLPGYALASTLLEEYESCWVGKAVGKLNATPYKTETQAEQAVMLSIDHADRKCVKLARLVWKTHGEAAWTEQHNYMIVQFSNANLQSYGW